MTRTTILAMIMNMTGLPYYHICDKYLCIIFTFSNRHSKSAAQPSRENTSDILLSATLNTSRHSTAKVVQHISSCKHYLYHNLWYLMYFKGIIVQKPMYYSVLSADVFLKTRIYCARGGRVAVDIPVVYLSLLPPTCSSGAVHSTLWKL